MVEHDDVDVVFVTRPNMLHVEMVEAAAANGKHVFCEKPVGGTPAQTVAAELAARRAGVISGVGYNYRWAPLVQYAKQIDRQTVRSATSPTTTGGSSACTAAIRSACCRGGSSSTRPATGVSTDILSHSVDLAHFLIGSAGPITRVVGTGETFIKQRPLPTGAGTHYDRGRPGDPTGEVTNEDYIGMMCVFESGARGTFEACRSMVGPESQNSFEIYGTKGSHRAGTSSR